MNPQSADALANLRDIHLPDPVSIWPLAPIWWVLIGSVLLGALTVHLLVRARRRNLKRAAIRELAGIEAGFRSSGDVAGLALGLATLLRRVAITRFPRRDVASLHGAEWTEFLLGASRARGMTEDVASELSLVVYAGPRAAPAEPRVEEWISATRNWIGGNT